MPNPVICRQNGYDLNIVGIYLGDSLIPLLH